MRLSDKEESSRMLKDWPEANRKSQYHALGQKMENEEEKVWREKC